MNKKVFIILLAAAVLSLIITIPAFASGWLPLDTTTPSPHAGLSVSSNQCKVCHAVHGANPDSYRLLRDGSRKEECSKCHSAETGLSGMIVYDIDEAGRIVKGSHDVDSADPTIVDPGTGKGLYVEGDAIPDSTKVVPERGSDGNKFNCYFCHSVHGAKIVGGSLSGRILRDDPAKDGGAATSEGTFCGDCHDKNETANSSHPLRAPTVDGSGNPAYEVYGDLTQVAWDGSQDCWKCHQAKTTSGYDPTDDHSVDNKQNEYPHQGTGARFLKDGVALSDLDVVCRGCHDGTNFADPTKGVGKSF